MRSPLNPNLVETPTPPIMEALGWATAANPPADRPVLRFSQAAPADPPPAGLRKALAEAVLSDDSAHFYGAVFGRDDLRAEIARQWSESYGGTVTADQVAITSGCNQAFCTAIASLAAPGDNVILPAPWYFNHKMWLDMSAVETRVLPTGTDMLPDPDTAARLIDGRTRAIVLVTPNNPTGAEYPAALMQAFFDLARDQGLALIVDETYRDFHSQPGAPHGLFEVRDWSDTLIQLYSFSKAYRLTGHRVGAIVTSATRLAQAEKFLDTTTICASQIGQIGALWGMRNLSQWLAGERAEILDRRAAMIEGMARLPGWTIRGCGAYFAYVEHPFDAPSNEAARRLVETAGVLLLPGTMFGPTREQGGDGQAERHLRVAFANADRAGLAQLFDRLSGVA